MCLTLANATDIRDHQDTPPPGRGYTRTHHRAGYLEPGDLWRPDDERIIAQRPHTVMAVSRAPGHVVLTDQFGVSFRYPADSVIPTVVLDAWSSPRIRQWK
jgi:hypothetical protein